MRIAKIRIAKFRRFSDLEVAQIPATARLVILAGPNGTGKSSLFDALLIRYRIDSNYGWNDDPTYFNRPNDPGPDLVNKVQVDTHDGTKLSRGSVYVRTAYRHDAEFHMSSLTRQGAILDSFGLNKLIHTDAAVAANYARLASQALEDVFVNEAESTTMGDYRNKLIGEVRAPILRLFPDLTFVGVGNPLEQGSFQFNKGDIKKFDYKNLSGGEKAAFDLVLDIVVKRRSYSDAIYCIDEPEAHLNTKVQGALLEELLGLLPGQSQLWIASHSIGMMRKARQLYDADPNAVVFLNFGGRDFDKTTVIQPEKPNRSFWESVLRVALDDLATLVAPSQIIICEGNPAQPVPGKNSEHDAIVYSTIFSEELPDVTFISAGSSSQVAGDFLGLATALPKVASGMKVMRLIDGDDHAPADIASYQNKGIRVLRRRHLEAYLYDDEVLTALCTSAGQPTAAASLIAFKKTAITASVARGNPPDDVKSAAGQIYNDARKLLNLTKVGNDQMAFTRNTLAPLLRPGMAIYEELKNDIFGP